LLHWVTATEINNSYFTIEHSVDGVIFTTCERIQGAGNSNYAISYEAIDHHPFKKTYYRLKQTDFDGKFTYSQIIVIALKNNSTRLISYPNPVSDVLHIQSLNNSDEILQFLISDVTGRTILSEKRNFPRENLTIDINTSVLSKGSYLLQIFNSKMEMVMGEVILK